MQSLTESFNELLQHLRNGVGSLKQTGFDPVYNLIFPVSDILRAKQMLPEMKAKLKLAGFKPHEFSVTTEINAWFRADKRRALWQTALRRQNSDYHIFRKQFSEVLEREQVLPKAIEARMQKLSDDPKSLLLITDMEALHPFLHFSGIEQQLVGKFSIPTVALYPGVRGGTYSLRFLGIHHENGNYRSIHIG